MDGYSAIGKASAQFSDPRAGIAPSKETADTAREFEIIEKEIARLGEGVGFLLQRIDPICRPSEPTPETLARGVANDRITSQFAAKLADIRRRIGGIADSVASAHSRLDL